MSDVWRKGRRGPEWVVSAQGISLRSGESEAHVAWDDLVDVVAEVTVPHASIVTLQIPGRDDALRLMRRWNNQVPPSSFIATVRSHLPPRLRTDLVDEALRDLWGFARGRELGATRRCFHCEGQLARTSSQQLHGGSRRVEVALREVDRRMCQRCARPHPLDEDQPGELLFDIVEQWDEPDLDWADGVSGKIHRRGFRSRPRGAIRVTVDDSPEARPKLTDCYLAVLNALCDEGLPG